mmetsp:Transcript_18901/g.23812  ORF Transcript_18901/g.23812 Transcript_18901/m.23812 type:complete len:278 (-) Transcript_18901:372-1205(-)|eukprot:CAMPEP_0203642872 /NCGR_PEP_ID=MMETSP0088-20131115/8272_1 /ASSEMBLY_ACC=CAM_ASM_001087 /TAXON_ID=426623 /ORGANISM="Chaetoceros affinis, Strain CCMP159" /LENGTH=277 /DNA_ID=CAMNT_0050498841 /DNA_START=25 /DNA_END=858 /DNA_ORIENTATION=+
MGLKLFKRKSKKKAADDGEVIKERNNQTLDNDEGIPSGLTDKSNMSASIDPNEGLYIGEPAENAHSNESGNISTRSSDSSNNHHQETPNKQTQKFEIISARDGADKFKVSQIRDTMLHSSHLSKGYKSSRTSTVPTARDSAYNGPPRYDWIDVEAAAAIKIQSTYRRHMVLTMLEREGKSTAAMRNTIRSRNANARKKELNSEDVPTFLRFCGFGFLFADATGEDTAAINAEQSAKRDERFNSKIEKEKKLRKFRMRQKSTVQYEEAVEVVDNVDQY